MKLRRKELCPLHKSFFCCGRSAVRKSGFQAPVRRIEDPHHPRGYREIRSAAEMKKLLKHHPRGYREIRSAAEMKKLLKRKVVEQNFCCGTRA